MPSTPDPTSPPPEPAEPTEPPAPNEPSVPHEHVLPMPAGAPASDEALSLARLAEDTLCGFETQFRGRLMWTHPMPGMIGVDDAATLHQNVIIQLLVKAYEARLNGLLEQSRHHEMLADRNEMRAYNEKHKEDYLAPLKEGLPEMFKVMEEVMRGKERVRTKTPQQQKELAVSVRQTLERLGLGEAAIHQTQEQLGVSEDPELKPQKAYGLGESPSGGSDSADPSSEAPPEGSTSAATVPEGDGAGSEPSGSA
jgi:hypothetical protein